jgi:DNA polymerase kappa
MHVDMDMFYAAVELRDNPKLKNKPVAVGDNTMITTTNYIARKYGVKSAMPGFIGRKLCHNLVFIKPNYPKYRAASEDFKKILS